MNIVTLSRRAVRLAIAHRAHQDHFGFTRADKKPFFAQGIHLPRGYQSGVFARLRSRKICMAGATFLPPPARAAKRRFLVPPSCYWLV
jgi:hypothetical protein